MQKNKFELANELQAQYHKALADIKEADFLELFRPMFEQFPQIVAVGWKQYTPSFNDGDPCTFRMGDIYGFMANSGCDEDGEVDESLVMTAEKAHGLSGRELETNSDYEAMQAVEGLEKVFCDLTGQISADLAERVFGDGVCIIISKDKITTRDYYCGY